MKRYHVHKSARTAKTQTEIAAMAAIDQLTKPNPLCGEPTLGNLKDVLESEIKAMPRRSVALPPQMFTLVLDPEYNPKVLRIFRNTQKHSSDWVTVTIKEDDE